MKNVNLTGNSNTTTLFGVGAGSSTVSTTSLGTGNNSNTFENCNISKTQYGIYSQGASAINKNTGTVIRRNLITTSSPDNVQIGGIMVGFEDNISITENAVSGMDRAGGAFGIGVGFVSSSFSPSIFSGNEATNAMISRNNIGVVTSRERFERRHCFGFSGLRHEPDFQQFRYRRLRQFELGEFQRRRFRGWRRRLEHPNLLQLGLDDGSARSSLNGQLCFGHRWV